MDGGYAFGYGDQIAEPVGPYAYLGSVVPVATSGIASPFSALRFDPYQELLWAGNEFGRVSSSFGPTLADYTAFVVGQVPVRDIEVTEDLVLTVGGGAFSGYKREGLLQFVHCSPHFENLTCEHRLPIAPNSILLGGMQNKIVQMDLNTLQEQRIVPLKQTDCLMIRSNDSALFTTDSKGNITMRSMNTVEAVRSAPAHSGGVTDFEVSGHNLVTCGYSTTTRFGTPFSDPFLKVYDIRNFGAFIPLNVSFPPFLCRFLNYEGDSRVIVVSKFGHLTTVDIQSGQVEPLYQFFEGCVPTALAVSSSSQLVALGDPAGSLHLLADREDPVFNLNSYLSTFPSMEECLPPIPFCDDHTPLSSVPVLLPQSSVTYCSDIFPDELLQRRYLEPVPVPSDLLLKAKKAQNVLYAPAPHAHTELRGLNVCPYAHLQNSEAKARTDPSGQAQGEGGDVDVVIMPPFYRRRKGRVRSGATTETDTTTSKEPYISLNELPPFQYINPLLLIMFYILPLRKLFLEHFCDAEHCVSCQLSFLYRMMSSASPGHSLSATNMIRTLRTYGEVGSILRLTETALAERNRRFINFLFGAAEKELPRSYGDDAGQQHAIDHITLKYVEVQRCTSCGTQWMNEHDTSVLRLSYVNQTASNTVRFSKLLEDSLNNEGARFDACSSCGRRSRIPSWREVKRLPSVLCLDTDITSASAKEFWKTQFRTFEKRPSSYNELVAGKICRYGKNCRGIGGSCRFRHPDTENPDEIVKQSSENWSHYLPLKFGAKFDGNSCVIQESFDSDTTNYVLQAFVALIKEPNESSHYVTLVRLDNDVGPRNWMLFNGHYVTTVTENEALYTSPVWKEPLFLFYANVDSEFIRNPGEIRVAKIPREVFVNCSNQSNMADTGGSTVRPSVDQLPVEGDLVGLDAEFVTISECGSVRSVGRVSCVKENGDLIIDDYIKTPLCDTVHDYLTPYSGIQEADLNPLTSTKHLAIFKSTYTKILYLVENGVVFVGHALVNDFGLIGISVPEEQIRDTVRLYSLPNQRMISLQFLAKQILDETIQEGVHDSVEDAKAALRLYKKHQDTDSDSFLDLVKQLYVTWERTRARSSS